MEILKEWLHTAKSNVSPREYFQSNDVMGDRVIALKLGIISATIGWLLLIAPGVLAWIPFLAVGDQNVVLGFFILMLFMYQVMWINMGTYGHAYLSGSLAKIILKRGGVENSKVVEEVYARTSPVMALSGWIPVIGAFATLYQIYATSIGLEESLDISSRDSKIAAGAGFLILNMALLGSVMMGVIFAFI